MPDARKQGNGKILSCHKSGGIFLYFEQSVSSTPSVCLCSRFLLCVTSESDLPDENKNHILRNCRTFFILTVAPFWNGISCERSCF